jgi:uncharacterized protein YjbI with pentapeptide repeats
MPSATPLPGVILGYKTRHDFTRSIEDPDTAPALRDAIRARKALLVVEGRCFNVQFFANAARFREVDAPPEANCSPPTLWQRFIRLIAGHRLRAHLAQSIDQTGAPTFMGPVAKWSAHNAAALRETVLRHRIILNCPLPEGHDAALYHLTFHTRGIDRESAELLFRQKQFNAEGLNFRRSMLKGIDLSARHLQRTMLNESELSDANLGGADLSGASLRGARLRRANLGGAQVRNADLRGADLREADLRGLDLTAANIEGATLRRARLEGTTLALAQLLTLIDQGVDVRGAKVRWPKERGQRDDGTHLRKLIRAGVDLTGADLRRLYLANMKFKGANLQGAKLRGAFLWGADLTAIQLFAADLRNANLAHVRLGYRTLAGARLNGPTLRSLKLAPLAQGIPGREKQEARQRADTVAYVISYRTQTEQKRALRAKLPPQHLPYDLCSVDLQGAQLSRFDFGLVALAGANLKGAILNGANLEGEKGTGPGRRGLRLERANLCDAMMIGAKLGRAHLRNAVLTGADLRGADLSGADLQGADLSRADLQGANLEGAKLEGAKLEGAKLKGANLEGTNLEGANRDSLRTPARQDGRRRGARPSWGTTRGRVGVAPAPSATSWTGMTKRAIRRRLRPQARKPSSRPL